jgi:hypothetical protein
MMLNVSQFVVESDSFIGGAIYWQHEGFFFPAPRWIDNVNIVINWWLGAIVPLTEGAVERLRFMEGPYCLKCVRSPVSGMVDFVGEANDGDTDFRGSISMPDLAEEILAAGAQLAREMGGRHPTVSTARPSDYMSRVRARLVR